MHKAAAATALPCSTILVTMIVPIVSSGGEEGGKLAEWAMVELQGKLEGVSGEDVFAAAGEVGALQVSPNDKDVVQLVIGYHQLEGRRVTLKKPFVILDKVEEQGEGHAGLHYKAVGVVRVKLLFKTRPTALISKPRR